MFVQKLARSEEQTDSDMEALIVERARVLLGPMVEIFSPADRKDIRDAFELKMPQRFKPVLHNLTVCTVRCSSVLLCAALP